MGLLATALLSLPLLSLQDNADEVRFTRARTNINALMKREKWKQASDALIQLVREQEGSTLVLRDRAQIIGDLKKCLFSQTYQPPDPNSLISGEILSWKEKSGRIKLRYKRGQFGDFQKAGDSGLLHPITFKGSYSVTASVRSYAPKYLPSIVVGWNTEQPETFFEDMTLSYAQSWAVVHFLRHSSKYRSRFEDLIERLMVEASVAEAIRGAFEGLDFDRAEADFRAHLGKL